MLITPQWPAPKHVQAFATTRKGGVSLPPFDGLNLGGHVGDDINHVLQNRALLPFASDTVWLEQVHGNQVIELTSVPAYIPTADGSFTRTPGVACSVMTADCLPVLLCDTTGSQVAAIHCGWRGLGAEILHNAVAQFDCRRDQIMAWLGPAIGPNAFEVGEDVRQTFPADWTTAFVSTDKPGKYLADIFQLATRHLYKLGIFEVYGGGECTYSQPQDYFSFRREAQTGRMASVICLT